MKASDCVLLSATVIFYVLLTVGALLIRHVVTSSSVLMERPRVVAHDTSGMSDPGIGAVNAPVVGLAIAQREP